MDAPHTPPSRPGNLEPGAAPLSQGEAAAVPPRMLHPPTAPGSAPTYVRPSGWPSVIGTICIVMGSLGVINAGLQAVSAVMARVMGDALKDMPGAAGSMAGTQKYMAVHLGLAGVGVLIAIVLIVGGARLNGRKRDSRAWLLGWATLKIMWGLGFALLTYVEGAENMRGAMNSMQTQGAGPPMGFFEAFAAGTAVLTALWYAALPVFLLVWFLLPGKRKEVQGW